MTVSEVAAPLRTAGGTRMSTLQRNAPWPAGEAPDAAVARRWNTSTAAVWAASALAHGALLTLVVSRFGAKTVAPPVVPPVAIEVVAPAKPAPVIAPPATPPTVQPVKPPPKPAPPRMPKSESPKPRASAAPATQAVEHAATQPPNTVPATSESALPAPAAAAAPVPAPSAPAPSEPALTPPIGNAAYLHNPAPRYPERAQEEGWEGRVVLRVFVDANGHPASVDIRRSSGHDVLDNAALAAVRRWTFVPAKRGSIAIEGWVEVPLDFRLN